MKNLILLLLLIPVIHAGYSQDREFNKPDYRNIKKEISDTQSVYYYPFLFERYLNADSSLTIDDFRMLYYGYLFNDSYELYPDSKVTNQLNDILNNDKLSKEDYRKIIQLEEKILNNNPFNLRDLNMIVYSCIQLGDTVKARQTQFKLSGVIDAIMSSGDGLKEETAFHVISGSHEYDLLNVLGFKFGGQQTLTKSDCDYLKVDINDYGISGLYFDVSMLLKKERELFK